MNKKAKKQFKRLGRRPSTKKDLENRNRNSALSEDQISLQDKERAVTEDIQEDTQRPLAA